MGVPNKMRLVDSNGEALSNQVEAAGGFIPRLHGLMGRKAMPGCFALILMPCRQIHTFFMRFTIDVIFLDRGLRVKHVIEKMRPWKISKLVRGSHVVVELPGGTLEGRVTQGDRLKLEE